MKLVRYLAWAWIIVIGALMITPGGIWCIACGQIINQPGYVGQTGVMILGIGAIILGLVGIATEGKAAAGVAAKGATAGK
jgi:hypothetical protein